MPDAALDLHHHYLLARGGQLLRPEPVADAWAWALHPVHGASSLLIPAGPSDEDQRYLAFDYLVDQPDHEPIPPETWHLLVARADPLQATRIASMAFWRGARPSRSPGTAEHTPATICHLAGSAKSRVGFGRKRAPRQRAHHVGAWLVMSGHAL